MIDTPAEQNRIFHVIRKKTLSVRETESLIQKLKKAPTETKAKKKGPLSS
jgi:hypothetical protein